MHVTSISTLHETISHIQQIQLWPSARMQFLVELFGPTVVHDRGGPTTVEGRAHTYNFELSTTTPMISRSIAALGILANKWRIFCRPFDVGVVFCDSMVKACCVLHNYVRQKGVIHFMDTVYECPL
jgi:hypothetical protein